MMMTTTSKSEDYKIYSDEDVVRIRQAVRARAVEARFSLIDQTKLVTAVSELARNTLEHGGGGSARVESLDGDARFGLRVTFEDNGKGIADIEQALRDGYTSGGGLGLGLGGARRLVNEFSIESAPNIGTKITITKWNL